MNDAHILHQIPYQTGLTAQFEAMERMTDRIGAQLNGLDLHHVNQPAFIGMGASFAAAALPVDLLRRHGRWTERLLACNIQPGMALPPADLVMAISQSGRSTETIQALSLIEPGARACLVNITDSDLGLACDRRLTLGDEPDSYASTVAYSGTLAALHLIAGALLGQDWSDRWHGTGERLETFITRSQPQIDAALANSADVACADIVADGAHRASAEEGALLLREVCRLPATSSTTRNYLHGEMESAGQTLHVVIGSGREIQLARMLAEAGHPCLLMTEAKVASQPNLIVIALTPGPDRLSEQVIASTMVMQCLAGGFAAARGVEIEDFVFHNDDTKTECEGLGN
ncbi:MAG: hypothetical protein LBV00_10845 [Propionibacteriaceae bacterium]|nr:hypothetical protein [Propionibacteriaceae bacterium]